METLKEESPKAESPEAEIAKAEIARVEVAREVDVAKPDLAKEVDIPEEDGFAKEVEIAMEAEFNKVEIEMGAKAAKAENVTRAEDATQVKATMKEAAAKPAVESYDGPLHVIIIGSGAGGLMVAQGLKQNGISYAVYEKDLVEGRVRDWGMAYYRSSESTFNKLLPQTVRENLCTAEVDYGLTTPQGHVHEYITVRDCSTGEIIKLVETPDGRRVSRKRFRKVLSQGINIQYGKAAVDISYPEKGAVVHFEDGTTASGSIVVGADGSVSKIRRLLLGEKAEPTILPYVMNNFNATYRGDQALFIRPLLSRFTDYGIHPKGMFFLTNMQSVLNPDDPGTWSFQLLTSWPITLRDLKEGENTSDGRLKVLKELTKDFAEPRRSMIDWVSEDAHISRDRLAIWSPVPWDNHGGRVTLLGDAAHSMTYHRGQGLNNCLNDAENLVLGLVEVKNGKTTLVEAIRRYDEEVVKRGSMEVELSRKQTVMLHDWTQFQDSPLMNIGLVSVKETAGYVAAIRAGVKTTPRGITTLAKKLGFV